MSLHQLRGFLFKILQRCMVNICVDRIFDQLE